MKKFILAAAIVSAILVGKFEQTIASEELKCLTADCYKDETGTFCHKVCINNDCIKCSQKKPTGGGDEM